MTAGQYAALAAWFSETCSGYYSSEAGDDRNIRLKEEHTDRVIENMAILVEGLGLDEGECWVARAIALLHDVGRFEQYRRYGTFRDSESVNHAALGVRILKDSRVLESIAEEQQRLILAAVSLHNVFHLPPDLRSPLTLMAKLIRDADKLDIWRVFVEYHATPPQERASAAGLGFSDLSHCSRKVLAEVLAGKMVDLCFLKTIHDFTLLQISWVFDLNFPHSFRLLQERGYVRQLAATLPEEPEVELALAKVWSFMERQCRHDAAA